MVKTRRISGGIGFGTPIPLVREDGDPLGDRVKAAVNNILKEYYKLSESKAHKSANPTVTVEETGFHDCSIQLDQTGVFFSVEWPTADDFPRVREMIPRIYSGLCSELERRNDVIFEGCQQEFLLPFESESAANEFLIRRFVRADSFPDIGYGRPRSVNIELGMGRQDESLFVRSSVLSATGEKDSQSKPKYFVDFEMDLRKTASIPFETVGNWTKHGVDFIASKGIAFLQGDNQ